MNKALAIFLILAGLVAIAHSADIAIAVSNDAGDLTFTPQIAKGKVGDNFIFTWNGPKMHSIVQSDEAKSCVKSAKQVIASGGPAAKGKTMTFPAKEVGKMWYFCGVPGHCDAGMYGTLIVEAADGAAPPAGGAPAGPGGATPSEGTPPAAGSGMPSGSPMPSGDGAASPSGSSTSGAPGAAATGSASRNYNSLFTSGLVFSSMCLAAAYML